MKHTILLLLLLLGFISPGWTFSDRCVDQQSQLIITGGPVVGSAYGFELRVWDANTHALLLDQTFPLGAFTTGLTFTVNSQRVNVTLYERVREATAPFFNRIQLSDVRCKR